MALSRRAFLTRIGQAGGYSAAFVALQGMGFVPPRAEAAPPLALPAGTGNGRSVVILGGGIAGLVSAYELRALGFHCTLLEARHRPGGRNWTLRGGDTVTFTDGTTQHCAWEEGHYQNAGAARLPSIHATMLGYCRKLGIPLEVEVNSSRSTYLQNDNANGGKPIVQRQAINDTRGHVSELLAKCVANGNLDAELTPADRERMLDFLRIYGPLDHAGKYGGSDRAGYTTPPGAGEDEGILSRPVDMHTLLDESFWYNLLYEEVFDWQATMFQPIGGMDRIPYAFAKSLGDVVRYNSPVREIRKTSNGVRIIYGAPEAAAQTVEADYCICAMPLVILKRIPNDFSAPYQHIINTCAYSHSYKIAWESPRFWEKEFNIYGGLEFVSQGPSPVWLPSAGMFSDRGVLVSGYDEELGTPFAGFTLQQKLAASRASVDKLHPGYGRQLEKPIYIGWGKIPYNEGAWIDSYGSVSEGAPALAAADDSPFAPPLGGPSYKELVMPDDRLYFAGDHTSHLVGWQEGAALSAHRAIRMIADHAQQTQSATRRVSG